MGDAGDKDTRGHRGHGRVVGTRQQLQKLPRCFQPLQHLLLASFTHRIRAFVPRWHRSTLVQRGPPGNCHAVPDGREQGQAQPCSPQPSASLLFTFTAKLQVSALYLFICVLVHRKGRWVWAPEAPKRARAHLGAQGCQRGGLERRAQPPPRSCFALSCSQPALAGDVLPSLEKTAARQPHGPKTQPSFGSRRCEDSPAAAGVPPAVSTHGKRHQSQVSAPRSPGSPRKPVKGASRDGVREAEAGVGVTPVPCKPPQNGDISFLG